MAVRPAKTQISLGIRPVWSESLLSTWRKLGSLATHWAHSEHWSDWADAQADLSLGAHAILLVLSRGGSYEPEHNQMMCAQQRLISLGIGVRFLGS